MKGMGWESRFDKLSEKNFGQDRVEFKLFIRFVRSFFLTKGIVNPVVVEIGTRRNRQKAFYRSILSARHIGIDISNKFSKPNILGDSHDKKTYLKLIKALKGRTVNLLFIDGDHTYDGVRKDYFQYESLVQRGIVAVHDIACEREGVEVPLFWSNLIQADHLYPYMTIFNWREKDRMGIGLQVRD